MDFRHPARSQPDRTRRENRHLNFYKRRDNLGVSAVGYAVQAHGTSAIAPWRRLGVRSDRVDVQTVADQLFFATALIKASGPSGHWSGTGFAYVVPADKGHFLALVSNKHVLLDAAALEFQLVGALSDSQPAFGKSVTLRLSNPTGIIGHPDPAVDVAALAFGGALNQFKAEGNPAFCRAIKSDRALTREIELELDAIEDVLFIGYPQGIYDRANFTPVARRGMTATPIALDYDGEPAFLVDAAVYPGSSGSPVFIATTGMYSTRDGKLLQGQRLILLGVLAAVHTAQVAGRVVHLPAQQTVEVDAPMGLGIVYKARTIDHVIDLLLTRDGAKRHPRPATLPDA